MLFEQGGWSADRLLLVTVQRMNAVFNGPTAGGPTPARPPDYEAFADLAERLERLPSAHLAGFNWEQKETETQPPGRNPRFWIRPPADPRSPLAADVAAVRRYLGLEPGSDEFALTAFPYKRQPTEVGVRCRSLLSVLYLLSQSVEPPPPDIESGGVTGTEDKDGRPVDWSRVTGKVMTIHSPEGRPDPADGAAPYRGRWVRQRRR